MRSLPLRAWWVPSLGLGVYAMATVLLICTGWAGPKVTWFLSTWNPIPTQIVLVGLMLPMIKDLQPGLRRLAWQLYLGSVVAEALGNVIWAWLDTPIPGIGEDCADALYVISNFFSIAAFIAFFHELGGSFKSRRVWLDASVLALALGVTSWLFLISPQIAPGNDGVHPLAVASYAIAGGVLMVLMALIVIQVMDWRAERAMAFLIVSLTITILSDVGWVAARARQEYELDTWMTIGGYCLSSAMLAVSVGLQRRRLHSTADNAGADAANTVGNLSVFLPILALMLALAALIGEETNPHGLRAAVLVGSAIAAAILILARQLGARYEIRTLYRTLAGKEAEAKLTELVRRSSDLIVVVKEGGELTYVSPAADKILGRSPHSLQSTPAAAMLGPDNQARLANFLADIAQRHAPSTEMEAVIATPAGSQRTVCIVGSDQSTNPAIEGITLTLRDVTEQRRLEGEVLEISAREQQRLSSDIHEGLGQDLTGISLLLKSLEKDAYRDPTAFAGFLQVIVGHVNRTIDTARNLATGLAPMQISRGSLDVALTNLVAEARTRFQLRLNLQISLCGYEIGAVEADHWYRIAREAINNAARHGRCRVIDVELATHDNRIVLIVADDGIGMDKTTSSTSGLGLRMIAYRARVMGGVMHLGTSVTGGAQILVSVPMSVAEPRLRAPDDERRGNISLH